MTRPIAVDLFACEGGMSAGLARAGFDVKAVDLDPNRLKRNPYAFWCGDWRDGLQAALALYGDDVRLVHAAPPCQGWSSLRCLADAQGRGQGRAANDLLPEVLATLDGLGLPYSVENVERSPLVGATLCGSHFGLAVKRHRVFQANFVIPQPRCAHHTFPHDAVTGRPRPWGVYGSFRDEIPSGGRTALSKQHAAALLGVEHDMTARGLKECVPPVYGAHVGAAALAATATFSQLALAL